MKHALGIVVLMGICVILLAMLAGAKVTFTGGNGSNMANAIVVNAPNEDEGVGAEYDWLAAKFGPRNENWKMDKQSTSSDAGKMYDVLEVTFLKDASGYKAGAETVFFFEISSFYGKY